MNKDSDWIFLRLEPFLVLSTFLITALNTYYYIFKYILFSAAAKEDSVSLYIRVAVSTDSSLHFTDTVCSHAQCVD